MGSLRVRALLAGIVTAVVAAFGVSATAAPSDLDKPAQLSPKELASLCALLDDPKKRALMDALELRLLLLCGRSDELGRVKSERAVEGGRERLPTTDTLVNDPTGESGPSRSRGRAPRAWLRTWSDRSANPGTIWHSSATFPSRRPAI